MKRARSARKRHKPRHNLAYRNFEPHESCLSSSAIIRGRSAMDQSKASYYADMVSYPILVAGLFMAELLAVHRTPFTWLWVSSCLLGIPVWTLVEYLLHRFVFHELPGIVELHAMHHSRPSAYIGSPVWVSFLAWFTIVFLPIWLVGDFEIAAGTTSGLILGYVWYLVVHDAVHRWSLKQHSWLLKARHRHLLHHRRADHTGNFGVSTGFWDVVFRTEIGANSRGRPQPYFAKRFGDQASKSP
jgi:sterol desaturase/sphingolipid hydroxylase (fatty acid hydroxylase superfamily)